MSTGRVNHFASELVYHGMQGPFVMSLLLNCTVNAEMGVVYIRLLLILFLLASKGYINKWTNRPVSWNKVPLVTHVYNITFLAFSAITGTLSGGLSLMRIDSTCLVSKGC